MFSFISSNHQITPLVRWCRGITLRDRTRVMSGIRFRWITSLLFFANSQIWSQGAFSILSMLFLFILLVPVDFFQIFGPEYFLFIVPDMVFFRDQKSLMLEIGKVNIEIANQRAHKNQITWVYMIFVKLPCKRQKFSAVFCTLLIRVLLVVIKLEIVALE